MKNLVSEQFENLVDHLEAIATGFKYLFLKKRLTLMYPETIQELPPLYRGMIRYYRDKCISCGLCARICPADAMKMYKCEDGKKRPGIDYTRCIFCGFCVDICPALALEHSDIHNLAYHTREEQVYPPENFEKGPPIVEFKKPPKKVRVEIDEERGLRYEVR